MIEVIKVDDKASGNLKAHDILKKLIDQRTLLVLSGGTSPDYRKMVIEAADVLPGAVCLADERWGKPLHRDSNELLLEDTGLIDYFNRWGIEYQKVLNGRGFEETAKDYNETISGLFERFKKRVGVMGIGSNLHTAGIFPQSPSLKSADLVVIQTVNDRFPKRITLTMKALEQFTIFIILVFGSVKQNALRIMLDDSEIDLQKYPAIFYRKTPIKSYLITNIDLE